MCLKEDKNVLITVSLYFELTKQTGAKIPPSFFTLGFASQATYKFVLHQGF